MNYYKDTPDKGFTNQFTEFVPYVSSLSLTEELCFSETKDSIPFPGYDKSWKNWGAKLMFYVNPTTDGDYVFTCTSLGSTMLFLDNQDTPFMTVKGSGSGESKTISLTRGLHLLRAFYKSSTGTNEISVLFGQGTAKYISSQNALFATMPPSFLQYNATSGLVGKEIHLNSPFVSRGFVDTYEIIPALPLSLTFNKFTGEITGVPTESLFQVYTITASSSFGSSQVQVPVLIGENPIQGLQATFYSFPESHDICTVKKFNDGLLTPVTSRLETILSHPLTSRNKPWPGVAETAFQGKIVGRWSGYFNATLSGTWSFSVDLLDGFRVDIDDEDVVSTQLCCMTTSRTVTFSYNFTVGLHSIFIEWFSNDQDSMFDFQMKPPGEHIYRDIPAELLISIPTQSLVYTIQRTVYYVNQKIEDNEPHVFGIPMGESFSITPALPLGLEITSDGVIRGMPIVASEETSYEVHMTAKNQDYTTVIILSVADVKPATFIRVFDKEGQETYEFTLPIYKDVPIIQFNCSLDRVYFTFSPELPEGITFDSQKLRLRGKPLTVRSSSYTVSAINAGGSVTTKFTLTVPSCTYGHWFYASSTSIWSDFYLLKYGEVIAQEIDPQEREHAFVFCVPVNSYILAVKGSVSTVVKIYRDDNTLYLEGSPSDGWFNTTLNMVVTEYPKIHFPVSTASSLINQIVDLSFKVEGIHSPPSFSPILPFDIIYDNDGTITCSSVLSGIHTFTISTYNDAGRVEHEFSFYVDTCPEGYQKVLGEKRRGDTNDHVKLYNEDSGLIEADIEIGNKGIRSFMLCMLPNSYSLTLYTSDADAGGVVRLRDSTRDLLAALPLQNDKNTVEHLKLMEPVTAESQWKMWKSTKMVDKSWRVKSCKERKWKEVTLPEIGTIFDTSRTVYLRRTFSLSSSDLLPAFLFEVHSNAGFIIYVNGNNVLSANIPADSDPSLYAADLEDWSQWRRVSASKDVLVEGVNVIAVEIHQSGDRPSDAVSFDMRSRFFTGSAVIVSTDGVATDNHGIVYRPPENAFDDDDSTSWMDRTIPAVIRYTFGQNAFHFVNRVILRGEKECSSSHPINFTIAGVVNETVLDGSKLVLRERYDILKHVYDPYLFRDRYEEVIVDLDTPRAYSAYELVVYETNSGDDSVVLNNIAYIAYPPNYCSKTRQLPLTVDGSEAYTQCGFKYVGIAVHRCSSNNTWATWEEEDRQYCLKRFPGSEEAFIDAEMTVYNCSIRQYQREVGPNLYKVLTSVMMLPADSVLLYVPHDCSEGIVSSTCVYMRLHPHYLASQYVLMQFKAFNANATDLFYEISKCEVENMVIEVSNIKLREQLSQMVVSMIVVVVVMSLIIIALLCMVGYLMKGKRSLRRKKLVRKADKGENEALLNDVQ